ncbi:response regulator [Paenibacillaceae bacterium]|nr:response regulator [Paenibacillaceae bacterium]
MISRWLRSYKQSLTRRFMTMMVLGLSLLLLGAGFVLWSTIQILQQYATDTATMRDKQEVVSNIADYSTEIVLRARGYLVYLNDFERGEVWAEKEKLEASINNIRQFDLSEDEDNTMLAIEDFFENYFSEVLPGAFRLAEAGDYDELRKFITIGEDNPVNKLIKHARYLESNMRDAEALKNEMLIKSLSYQGLLFLGYVALILIISLFVARKVATDIGSPLRQLSDQAGGVAKGDRLELQLIIREDEIGQLSRSFNHMIFNIQNKEEELLAQNEELQAQQDELQAQQEELQKAIQLMGENEVYLEKRNQLVQSLANTLDKKVLLQSIIENIVNITNSDKGMIVMMNSNRDYAAFGISEAAAGRFIASVGDSVVQRVAETLRPHLVSRTSTAGEQGYHEHALVVSELYVPISNADQTMAACLIVTRVGNPFSKQDEYEIVGMAKQISLSFDKLNMFEESERQRQMMNDMLNTIHEGVQFLDMAGRTLQANAKMTELFGTLGDANEVSGLELADFIAIVERQVVNPRQLIQFVTQLTAGEEPPVRSMTYELHGEERRFIQIYYEPLYRERQRFGLLLVHRDITKEYEVDRMKSEFVSTVSHELRTPLASVLGFAELLLYRELKPERQKKYITTIHQEARRLTTLINDFLDLQRMESGKQVYDMKPTSLTELITETVSLLQLGETMHTLVWNPGDKQVIIFADADKLKQVMTNLVSNAIKYSPDGGEVRIMCQQDHEEVTIEIQDNGLGIPEDALSKLFTKFYRVDNSDRREIGGTGLGLAIVKEIVMRHNGDITVQSELGKGSTFVIKLPLHRSQDALQEPDAGELPLRHSPRVMVVENDHNLSVMLRDELQSSGFHVFLYTDGQHAIANMERIRPDVIVIDLMLETGCSGWDVIAALKTSPAMQNTPIIISSAFEEKEKAAGWGIREFLVKPYLPGKLSSTIQRLLQS